MQNRRSENTLAHKPANMAKSDNKTQEFGGKEEQMHAGQAYHREEGVDKQHQGETQVNKGHTLGGHYSCDWSEYMNVIGVISEPVRVIV